MTRILLGIDKLIKKHGRTVTLTKKTSVGTYNPATGSYSGATSPDTDIFGYFYSNKLGKFGEVTTGKRMFVCSGFQPAIPDKGDYLAGDFGDDVRIGQVSPIYDGTSVAVYLCEVEE